MYNFISPLFVEMVQYSIKSKNNKNYYFCACIFEQIYSDVLLMAKLSENIELTHSISEIVHDVRKVCMTLSNAFVSSDGIDYSKVEDTFLNWKRRLTKCQVDINNENELIHALYKKTIDLSVPECSGYDICDVEICASDAQKWVNICENAAVIIGIRSGGSFYAPFWGNICKQNGCVASYITIRPLRMLDKGILLFSEEFNYIFDSDMSVKKTFIIVDDQMDTGNTVMRVYHYLLEYVGSHIQVYISSPGRLYKINSSRLFPIHNSLPINFSNANRIWQNKTLDRNKAILKTLTQRVNFSDCKIRIEGSHSRFHNQYKTNKKWKWWYEYVIKNLSQMPKRINPRKTPVAIKVNDKYQIHVKFIGKDIFGEFLKYKLKEFADFMPEIICFADGFLFSKYENNLEDFIDVYHSETMVKKKELLMQICKYFDILINTMSNIWDIKDYTYNFQDVFRNILAHIKNEIDICISIDDKWIKHYIPKYLNIYGSSRTYIRSSLPYSHSFWHWKVKREYETVKVYKFAIDSNWGDIIPIDLEIASFALENRLNLPDIAFICNNISKKIDIKSAIDRIPEALTLKFKTWLRRKNELTHESRKIIRQEIDECMLYVSAIYCERNGEGAI